MRIFIIFLVTCLVAVVLCNHYSISNPTIVYFNPKYVDNLIFEVTKAADGDVYIVHVEGENKVEWGNNISVEIALKKKVNDAFVPTNMKVSFELCKFLDEPWGKLLLKQLPHMSCPFPIKKHQFTVKSVPLDQLPFGSVLTADPSWKKGARFDYFYFDTNTKEPVLNSTVELKVT